MKTFLTLFLFSILSQLKEMKCELTEDIIIQSLPKPKVRQVKFWDPNGVTVTWRPIPANETNNILGFKLNVWDDQRRKVHRYEEIDGVPTLVKRYEPISSGRIKPASLETLLKLNPIAVITVGPNETSASYSDLELEVHYQILVQAYNAFEDGPFSDPDGGYTLHAPRNDTKNG